MSSARIVRTAVVLARLVRTAVRTIRASKAVRTFCANLPFNPLIRNHLTILQGNQSMGFIHHPLIVSRKDKGNIFFFV